MKDLFEKLKKPLIILAVLVGAFIVYNTFIKKDSLKTTSLLKTSNVGTPQTPEETLLPLLLKIQNVTLDEKLFLDPVFRALVDRTQNIVPESVGKSNPFAGTLNSSVTSSVESLGFADEMVIAPTASTKNIVTKPAVKK